MMTGILTVPSSVLRRKGLRIPCLIKRQFRKGPATAVRLPSARYLSPEPFPFKLLGNGIFLEPLAPLDRDSQTSATRSLFWSHQIPSERPGRWKSSASAKHRGSISMSGFVSLSNS